MKSNLFNILKKELRELFRDKKSLAMMLIIPAFIPLLMLGMSALFTSEINKDIEEYNKIGFAYELSLEEQALLTNMKINSVSGKEEELKQKYENNEIHLYVTKNENKYTVVNDGSDISSYANQLISSYFEAYKQVLQESYLKNENIPVDEVINIITVEEKQISFGENNFFADYIKNYSFLFIIMAITVSATYPSTDTTAGEKERGTLETLLTFPIKSKDIILGKFLSVSLSSIITGLISFLLAIITLIIAQNMFPIYEGVNIMLSPISILFSAFVIIAYSFFISGLCIAIASKSKSFKEAQSALTPLTFISFFPGMVAFMTGMQGTPFLSIIPFLNYTITFTDITAGNIHYLNIFLVLLSSIVYIGIILMLIVKQYKSEKILFSK